MSEPAATIQTELQCSACGGQRVFTPGRGTLTCQSCGAEKPIRPTSAQPASTEFAYDGSGPADDPVTERTEAHTCQTCGGTVIFVGAALSETCAYCNGPIVKSLEDRGYRAMALIPFQQEEARAWDEARAWASSRLAAPADLLDHVNNGRMAALYAPFFTFDTTEFVKYSGYHRVRYGKRTRLKPTSGRFMTEFDDFLVPASPHITPLIRDGVIHDFSPALLQPYDPAFLAGFGAEQHHLTVAEGLDYKARDRRVILEKRIDRHSGKPVERLDFHTDQSGVRYRRILLPVFILHYEYEGTAYKIVTCGLNATTFGERPFSKTRLMGYAAWISALALGLGALWRILGGF
ncbi:MAG: hypothetical protein AAF576_09405 [Pseudomonadota bacterium]